MSLISISSPVITLEKFAELSGQEIGVIRGMVERKQLPSKKYGKRRFVNVAAITAQCLQEAGITLVDDDQAE